MGRPFSDSKRGSRGSEDLGDGGADLPITLTCIHNWKHTQPTAHYSANWTGSINLKVNGKPFAPPVITIPLSLIIDTGCLDLDDFGTHFILTF